MMAAMTWVDYTIIIIISLMTLSGLMRGLVKEILSLIVLAAAFFVAITFSDAVAQMFTASDTMHQMITKAGSTPTADNTQVASYAAIGLAFAALFLGTWIIGAIITMIINFILTSSVLGFGNRLLGGVFGFVKGVVITLVVVFLVQLSALTELTAWKESVILPYYQPVIVKLSNLVSPSLIELKATFMDKVTHKNEKSNKESGAAMPANASTQDVPAKAGN